jgi:hypothetical protein
MLLALAAMLAAVGVADAPPRCFGAKSRDPGHRCNNPKLRKMVVPKPRQAALMPFAPCTPLKSPEGACRFGAPADRARATVALLGDSHADHWRASLLPMAKALRWSVVSLSHPACPLSRAAPVGPRKKRHECLAWRRTVTRWLRDRPRVETVITSNHLRHVLHRSGTSERQARFAGIVSALKKLPESVKHVIVIRDIPFARQPVLTCVGRAIHRHRNAGRACAFSRRKKLHDDLYVEAAGQVPERQVDVADMTQFFCGPRRCYPVVGGALVYGDSFGHLTTVYGRTLAPYLRREVKRLTAAWR